MSGVSRSTPATPRPGIARTASTASSQEVGVGELGDVHVLPAGVEVGQALLSTTTSPSAGTSWTVRPVRASSAGSTMNGRFAR